MKFVFAPGNAPASWTRGEPLKIVYPQERHQVGMVAPHDRAPAYFLGRQRYAFDNWLKWWNEPTWQDQTEHTGGTRS